MKGSNHGSAGNTTRVGVQTAGCKYMVLTEPSERRIRRRKGWGERSGGYVGVQCMLTTSSRVLNIPRGYE